MLQKKINMFLSSKKVTVVILAALILVGGFAFYDEYKEEQFNVFFVVRGEASIDGRTLTIEPNLVEWVTDRPDHKAGRIEARELSGMWAEAFKSSSPNAVVAAENTNTILELDSLTTIDGIFTFDYTFISGDKINGNLGEVTVFIDRTKYAPTENICNHMECDGNNGTIDRN